MRSFSTSSRIALLAFAVIAMNADVNASDYFVRQSGKDSNNGRSPGSAFKTFSKAKSTARAGDTIYVGAGTYTTNTRLDRSGTSRNAVRFVADSSGAKTGDSGTVTLQGSLEVRASYIQLEGFKITGSGDFFKWKSGYGGLLKNCEVTGGNNGLKIGNGAELHVLNCKIHRCGDDGIDIEGRSRDYNRRSGYEEVLIESSEISNNGDNGIDVENNRKVIVKKCLIHSNRKDGIDIETRRYWGSIGVVQSRIYNNGDNGVSIDDGRAMLENCLIYGNRGAGVEIEGESSRRRRYYSDYAVGSIWHCTITNNSKAGVDVNLGFARVMNSIVTFNGQRGVNRTRGYAYLTGSLLFGNRSGDERGTSRYERSNIYSDPKFVSTTDFRLRSGSPAIDAAYASRRYDFDRRRNGYDRHRRSGVDIDDNRRPVGRANDIGCYEGGAATSTQYYVSTSGRDSNDGRSASRPFRTIGKAASVVEPGDKVNIAAGTYNETPNLRKAGTEDAPIRFVGAGRVTLQPASKNQWSMYMNNADHTTFENIRFSGANVPYGKGWAYGVYNYYSEVTFKNCEFEKMLYGSYNVYAGVKFENCNFHDGYSHSLRAYYGGVDIDRCEFKDDAHGPLLYRNHFTRMKNSKVTGMKGWALQVGFDPYNNYKPLGTNTPTIENCTIEDNANGLILSLAKQNDRINWSRTAIKKTKGWELYLHYCDLDLTPKWRSELPIDKGGSGIYSYGNKLRIRNMKIEDYPNGWGMLDYYSDLTMSHVDIRRNYHGMRTYGPVKFSAENCRFDNNKYWGLQVYNHRDEAKAELHSCSMSGNAYGVYLYRCNKRNLELRDTIVANNSSYGVYLRDCDAEFSPNTMGKRWRLTNNGHGITTWGGKALFDNVKISGNKHWGALTYYTDITVRNCNFRENGSGFLAYYNKSAQITNSHFDENRSYGMQLSSNGKYYGYNTSEKKWGWWPTNQVSQLRNSTMRNNGAYGLHLSGAKERSFRISGIELTGNNSAGLYATHSELVFDPRTMNTRWKISDNGSHIYASYGKYQFKNLDFSDAKRYGIYTWYSDVDIDNCDFERNGSSGFVSYYNKSLTAKNSNFNENKSWGMSCYHNGRYYGPNSEGKWGWQDDGEPAELTGCSFEKNGHGLHLSGATDRSIKLVNTPINDNNGHGLYAVHCDLTFSPETVGDRWQIKNNGHGITTYYGKTVFDNVDVTGSKWWGALTYYGDVTVRDSKFTGNGSGGIQSYYNRAFTAEDSQFVENGSWGLSYYSNGRYYGYVDGKWQWTDGAEPGKFKNCLIANNKSHGMYVGGSSDDALIMSNTEIRDNPGYGLYAVHSDLKFTKDTVGSKWNISKNGNGIGTYYGKTLFDGVEIADNKSWGVLTHYGDVTVRDSTFTRNGYAGLRSYYNKSFSAENSTFSENGSWGMLYYSNGKYYGYKDGKWAWHDGAEPGKFTDCNVINNKNHGLYVHGGNDQTLDIANTKIQSNPGHGLYAVFSDLTFNADTLGKQWKISNNGHGITNYYGKMRFDGATIADNKYWGVLSYYADTAVKNSTFTRNGHGGLHSYYDRAFSADNSKFNENGSWGMRYYGNGTFYGHKDGKWGWHEGAEPAKIVGCDFSKNKSHGVGFSGIDDDRIVMSSSQATENGSIGIYFSSSKVTLSPDTSGKWVSRNNGHGFHASYSDVTIEDFEITGNKSWGMYTYYSNVALKNAKFSGNGHNMYWYTAPWAHGFKHKLTVDSSVFENSTGHHGLLTYYGPVEIKNSTFRGNKGDGLYTVYNKSVKVENSTFTGNKRWGTVFHVNYPQTSTWTYKELFKDNVQTITGSTVDDNGRGVYVYNAEQDDFALTKSSVTNNDIYSLYYNNTRQLVDHNNDQVTLDKNGYGPYATNASDVTFRNVVNQNSVYHGFLNSRSKVSLENCVSTGSRYGFYQYRPTALTSIKNSRFDGSNDNWGWAVLSYGGGVDSMNNVFNGFYNGTYTYTYGDEAIVPVHTFYNNTFAGLRYWGIYVPNNSKATAMNNILAHRSSDATGYGLARTGSGQLTHSHNLVHGFAAPFYGTSDANETTIFKNPRFADLANGNLRLGKGSPAINSGADLALQVPYDMEGNTRPSYKVFEMGAYEYTRGDGAFRVIDWSEKK